MQGFCEIYFRGDVEKTKTLAYEALNRANAINADVPKIESANMTYWNQRLLAALSAGDAWSAEIRKIVPAHSIVAKIKCFHQAGPKTTRVAEGTTNKNRNRPVLAPTK